MSSPRVTSPGGSPGPTTLGSNATHTYAMANELFNYGNGTSVWYNLTNITPGDNAYQLTASLATVDSYYAPGLGSHYVAGINHVVENSTTFWTLWVYCEDKAAWAASDWGVDYLIIEKNGIEVQLLTGRVGLGANTLAWYFQRLHSTDPTTWQPPQPGANKVSGCL